MRAMRMLLGPSLVSFGLLGGWAGSASASGDDPGQPNARVALRQLQSDFHEAITTGDVGLMGTLWARDAVFSHPGGTIRGRRDIVEFFASGALWGEVASLTPSYKAAFDPRGDRATLEFECVAVHVGGLDPWTTPLSSLPPGSQNPAVEIVQHTNASCTAVRRGRHWMFQTFNGSGGPIVP